MADVRSMPRAKLTGNFVLSSGDNGEMWGVLRVPQALASGYFMALNEPGTELPPYRAHITVMKPEDVEAVGGPQAIKEKGRDFEFVPGAVRHIKPEGWNSVERVWFLTCSSPQLETLRRSYGLTPLPENNRHPFHITVAMRRKGKLAPNLNLTSKRLFAKKSEAPRWWQEPKTWAGIGRYAAPALGGAILGHAVDVLRREPQDDQRRNPSVLRRNLGGITGALGGLAAGHLWDSRYRLEQPRLASELLRDFSKERLDADVSAVDKLVASSRDPHAMLPGTEPQTQRQLEVVDKLLTSGLSLGRASAVVSQIAPKLEALPQDQVLTQTNALLRDLDLEPSYRKGRVLQSQERVANKLPESMGSALWQNAKAKDLNPLVLALLAPAVISRNRLTPWRIPADMAKQVALFSATSRLAMDPMFALANKGSEDPDVAHALGLVGALRAQGLSNKALTAAHHVLRSGGLRGALQPHTWAQAGLAGGKAVFNPTNVGRGIVAGSQVTASPATNLLGNLWLYKELVDAGRWAGISAVGRHRLGPGGAATQLNAELQSYYDRWGKGRGWKDPSRYGLVTQAVGLIGAPHEMARVRGIEQIRRFGAEDSADSAMAMAAKRLQSGELDAQGFNTVLGRMANNRFYKPLATTDVTPDINTWKQRWLRAAGLDTDGTQPQSP